MAGLTPRPPSGYPHICVGSDEIRNNLLLPVSSSRQISTVLLIIRLQCLPFGINCLPVRVDDNVIPYFDPRTESAYRADSLTRCPQIRKRTAHKVLSKNKNYFAFWGEKARSGKKCVLCKASVWNLVSGTACLDAAPQKERQFLST